MSHKNRILKIIKVPLSFIVIMWGIKCIEIYSLKSFLFYGVLPRSFVGLKGILFAPFIHKDFTHLLNNTYPLLILGALLFHFFKKVAINIFLWIFFISGIWLWSIGRAECVHIGSSGIIYGLASFIFFSGIIRKQTKLAAMSLLVTFLYGSMIWGLLPFYEGVSWEGHLSGLLAGILIAIYYKDKGPRRDQYQWEIDEEIEQKLAKEKTLIKYVYGKKNN